MVYPPTGLRKGDEPVLQWSTTPLSMLDGFEILHVYKKISKPNARAPFILISQSIYPYRRSIIY